MSAGAELVLLHLDVEDVSPSRSGRTHLSDENVPGPSQRQNADARTSVGTEQVRA